MSDRAEAIFDSQRQLRAKNDPAEALADELLVMFHHSGQLKRDELLAAIRRHYPEPSVLCGNCGKRYRKYQDDEKHGWNICQDEEIPVAMHKCKKRPKRRRRK